MKRGMFLGAVALFTFVLVCNVDGVAGKDKVPTVKEIMAGCMKSGLCKKVVIEKKGTDEEQAKLFKLLSALEKNKAPEGTDDANWKKLTKGISEAVKSGDLGKVKDSLKCADCHKEYKGK
jgi:hypothetical protein